MAKEQAGLVQLCRPSGASLERSVIFNMSQDVESQMEMVCRRFKESYDKDTQYFVLTASTDAASKILVTPVDLAEALNTKETLGLWRGEEMIDNRMTRIQELTELEEVDKTKLRHAIAGLFNAIRGHPILAEISIEIGGIEQVFKCITNQYVGPGDEDVGDQVEKS